MMNYSKRVDTVRKQMVKKRLDAVLVSSIPNITYSTGCSNFSKDEREAFLLITKNRQYILTDGRYSEAVKEKVPHFILIEISSTSPFKKALGDLAKTFKLQRVGFEQDNITVSEYQRISSCFSSLQPFEVSDLRIIKEKEEIDLIEQACQLGDKTFDHILQSIKPELSEKEVSFELEYYIKRNGADVSFPPIVAFGSNSSVPHHQTGNQALERGDIVLLDFGVRLNNYCSDMTRVVFLGKVTTEQKRLYQTVFDAQQKAIEFLQGVSLYKESPCARDVDKVARDFIVSKGYPAIPHSLGHGIGLEVHESPRLSPTSKEILKPGMVFSIEPGIYIPGFGGVRIEDLFVFETSGLRQLTSSPKELIEL